MINLKKLTIVSLILMAQHVCAMNQEATFVNNSNQPVIVSLEVPSKDQALGVHGILVPQNSTIKVPARFYWIGQVTVGGLIRPGEQSKMRRMNSLLSAPVEVITVTPVNQQPITLKISPDTQIIQVNISQSGDQITAKLQTTFAGTGSELYTLMGKQATKSRTKTKSFPFLSTK